MANRITILDGGMGRELKRMGAPFRQPEWSALALIEAPDFVKRAHLAFIAAGAGVITTNSYALVPFHLGEERFSKDGHLLADRAGRVARAAAGGAEKPVRIAGSLPPLFGSYRPDLFRADRAPAILALLHAGLSPYVDLWLAETLGSIVEAEAVAKVLEGDKRPLWISFTLDDEDAAASPVLRSGEDVATAAERALELGAEALLFNCSQPEVMAGALTIAKEVRAQLGREGVELGAYANAFPPQRKDATANETVLDIRDDLGPEDYLAFAKRWAELDATIIGGCCGIGPEHIKALSKGLHLEQV